MFFKNACDTRNVKYVIQCLATARNVLNFRLFIMKLSNELSNGILQ